MKLDLDCIRDILLTVEENTGYNEYMTVSETSMEYSLLKKHDNKQIMYHIIQSEKANLIEAEQIDLAGNILIKDLTPYGHKFIANIRENSNWNKIKKIANEVGTTSLEAIMQIAINVIGGIITSKF